jgi:hypothetical protein
VGEKEGMCVCVFHIFFIVVFFEVMICDFRPTLNISFEYRTLKIVLRLFFICCDEIMSPRNTGLRFDILIRWVNEYIE